MSDDKTTLSARVDRSLSEALAQLAEGRDVSKSDLLREAVREQLLEADGDLPKHLRVQVEREAAKARNRPTWQRIYFPSTVARKFRQAFEKGALDGRINPGAAEEIAQIYLEEADLLFEDPDRRKAAKDYVDAVRDHAREAADASEFDALDPGEMFDRYAGVEDGLARQDFPELVADAKDRLSGAMQADPDAVARSLSNAHGVSEALAREAVQEARSDLLGGGSDE